jgi:hypothetical protein
MELSTSNGKENDDKKYVHQAFDIVDNKVKEPIKLSDSRNDSSSESDVHTEVDQQPQRQSLRESVVSRLSGFF